MNVDKEYIERLMFAFCELETENAKLEQQNASLVRMLEDAQDWLNIILDNPDDFPLNIPNVQLTANKIIQALALVEGDTDE